MFIIYILLCYTQIPPVLDLNIYTRMLKEILLATLLYTLCTYEVSNFLL